MPAAPRRDVQAGVPPERIELIYRLPLAEVVRDFFDQLKSRTQGYASLDYEPAGHDRSDLVRADVLLNGVAADVLSAIVHKDKAYDYGRRMAERLRQLIPRQLFDVPIQAAIGGRIISLETVKAKRKDVLAKCWWGRHHPQAQAVGTAEGGQEADEVDRAGRGTARGIHQRLEAG